MKKLNAAEFSKLNIIGSKRDMIFVISHSSEIVSIVKNISKIIGILRIGGAGNPEVDFMGCSSDYVEEKIELAIRDLQWMKRRIKEIKD